MVKDTYDFIKGRSNRIGWGYYVLNTSEQLDKRDEDRANKENFNSSNIFNKEYDFFNLVVRRKEKCSPRMLLQQVVQREINNCL